METREKVFCCRDSRIIYVRKEGNIAHGRNVGLLLARGRYITYCDDDERYYRTRLIQLKKFLDKNPEVGLVYTDQSATKGKKEIFRFEYDFDKARLEAMCFFGAGNVMHRMECIHKEGCFDEKLTISEDWDMWLRISNSFLIARFPKVLHRYLVHDGNITINETNVRNRNYEDIVRKIVSRKIKEMESLRKYIKESSLMTLGFLLGDGRVKYAAFYTRKYCKDKSSFQSIACHGICELIRGNYLKAINRLRTAIKRASQDLNDYSRNIWRKESIALAYFFLARAYIGMGDVCSAMLAAKKAESVCSLQCVVLLLAECYIKKGRYGKALLKINECKERPYDYFTHKGFCHYAMGQYKEAIKCFKDAIALQPQFALARYNLAMVYFKRGKISEGVAECRKILEKHPNHVLAKRYLDKYI